MLTNIQTIDTKQRPASEIGDMAGLSKALAEWMPRIDDTYTADRVEREFFEMQRDYLSKPR
jgi:hypothetical protein